MLGQMDKRDPAIAAFDQALGTNPDMTAAWVDLGHLFYRSYDMERAWACWDIARNLQADHPSLTSILEMEQDLVTRHPGFF